MRQRAVQWVVAAVLMATAGAWVALPTPAEAQTTATQHGKTLRDRLKIVGSRTMQPIVEALVEHYTGWTGHPKPEVDLKGSTDGIRRLCSGVGPQFPDIAVSSRRIHHNEVEICDDAGVGDLIEVAVGYDAVVLAMRSSDTPMALKLEHVYRAVAAVLPEGEEFEPNEHTTWDEIDPSLPKTEIRFLIPTEAAGTRGVFNDIFLEGGCRYVKEIRQIFDAVDRVERCTGIRTDGRVTEVEGADYIDDMIAKLRDAPPGTIAVMDYDLAHYAGIPLTLLPIEGIAPTPMSIALDDYDASTKHFLYFKKAHMPDASGKGVVHGIRQMIEETVSERAIGPGGYVVKLGLIALSNVELARQRHAALRLRRLDPTD